MSVKEIFRRFEPELEKVEKELHNIFNSRAVTVPSIGKHILDGGGKRLRPLYLILTSELSGYREKSRLVLASIIEAIHTASLLHDDVIDGAEIRRGKTAAHHTWGNQLVILTGDFIYAHALSIAAGFGSPSLMEAITSGIIRMTEGELLQLQKIADPAIEEDEYLKIIASKTGALFSAASRIGGILGNRNHEEIEALTNFGLKTGIAFQMSDDILDFEANEEELGKSLGKDLEEGKITLPLIHLLKAVNKKEKKEISDIIKRRNNGAGDKSIEIDLRKILSLLNKYSVIQDTQKRAGEIVSEARRELSIFENSAQKDDLLAMADFALQRRK